MTLQKITGPDGSEMTGFIVTDLDSAAVADGVVRCAKKVLLDGARTMARSRTYAWALIGERISGASAGISVPPDDREVGIAAFVEAARPRVESGALSLDPAKGVTEADLAELNAVDGRSPLLAEVRTHGTLRDELLASGVVAAATAVLGSLDGRTVTIEGAGAAGPALIHRLAGSGASVVAVGTSTGTVSDPAGLDPDETRATWVEHGEALPAAAGSTLGPGDALGAPADVLICGSKVGVVDHGVAADLGCRAVVPIAAVPVTAKALAVASARGITVLADFATTSGPLFAFRAPESLSADAVVEQAASFVSESTAALLDHPDGPLLAACYEAERFLLTWQEKLPFGRPLA